jgi:AcrR family transcriptional regulator
VPSRPRKRSPHGRVGEATFERILKGASRAFAELGYVGTRVEDILLAAETTRPTFYKAFGSKDDVFELLSERHHRDIQERIVRSLQGVADPLAQLEAVVDTFMRWRAELGPLGRVLDQEARTPGTLIHKHRKQTILRMSAFGASLFDAAGRGRIDPVMFHGLVSALEGIADALLQRRPAREDVIARAKRNALRILAATLGRAGDALPPVPHPPE